MRITILSPDTPYPPNRGGRADVWRRLCAFVDAGHQVTLINAEETDIGLSPSKDDLDYIKNKVVDYFNIPIIRNPANTARRLSNLHRVPWHASTRIPGSAKIDEIISYSRKNTPDLIWLDGPWMGELAKALIKETKAPMFYRSHNIEHMYMRGQARASLNIRRKMSWHMACIGLKEYEIDLMRRARNVFDISADDLIFWKNRDINKITWLPPICDSLNSSSPKDLVHSDVAFIGNLATPNNVKGIYFLIDEVAPLVRASRPGTKFLIAGSRPSEALISYARERRIEVHANVDDPRRYQFGAKVLVNPVMTGSGVQLKTVDMLMTDNPIISHPQGLRGLSVEIQQQFLVAESGEDFSAAIISALEQPFHGVESRNIARNTFSAESVINKINHEFNQM